MCLSMVAAVKQDISIQLRAIFTVGASVAIMMRMKFICFPSHSIRFHSIPFIWHEKRAHSNRYIVLIHALQCLYRLKINNSIGKNYRCLLQFAKWLLLPIENQPNFIIPKFIVLISWDVTTPKYLDQLYDLDNEGKPN